jgi:Tfp pilus assembly PilM family ATPase
MANGRDRRNPIGGVGAGFNPLDAYAPAAGAADEAPAAEAHPAPTATATAAAIKPSAAPEGEIFETLVDELQLCLGYHGSVFADRPVEKIVFLGGESRQLSLCQKIAQALRLPAQLGDPLARLIRPQGTPPPTGVDLRQSQPAWAVPMGLCLLPTNL